MNVQIVYSLLIAIRVAHALNASGLSRDHRASTGESRAGEPGDFAFRRSERDA
jgi:hypothetical protein